MSEVDGGSFFSFLPRTQEVPVMARVVKRLLDPQRRRRIPAEGFSWMDRRLIRHGIAESLTGPELLLYFFLCSVADAEGLSFYSAQRMGRLLKLRPKTLEQARQGLLRQDLIRYDAPLYQVLSLPTSEAHHPFAAWTVKAAGTDAASSRSPTLPSLGEVLDDLL